MLEPQTGASVLPSKILKSQLAPKLTTENTRQLTFENFGLTTDMGFRPAIEKTLKMLAPKDTRQTLLFSATMPDDVSGASLFNLVGHTP